MNARLIIVGALALLVGLGYLWFHENFEKGPAKEWVGPSGEARLRQFLAAERFAERMGWKARELRSLPELDSPPARGVLLLPNGRQALSGERLGTILGWVARGGHLIAEAEARGVPDPLFDLMEVAREEAPPITKPFSIELPRSGRRLTVSMPGVMKLVPPPDDEIRFRVGEQLLSFGHGDGVITVASTLNFARNRAIGANDHAELLWHVLSLTPARELAVFFRPGRLSLWGFLKENAAPVLVAGGLLLALWLWSIMPRFGPVAPDAPPGRRRLLDHLRASGRYFWASGLRSRLVVAARDAALRRISRAQPDFAAASAAERARRLASLTRLSLEESQKFLTAAGAMRGIEFIKVTQQAQRVHSALEKGAK
jgi:hypothetical protein